MTSVVIWRYIETKMPLGVERHSNLMVGETLLLMISTKHYL